MDLSRTEVDAMLRRADEVRTKLRRATGELQRLGIRVMAARETDRAAGSGDASVSTKHSSDADPVLQIRPESPADIPAIRRVNEAAFGQPLEADLVDALREAARPFLSLVAEDDGEIVGHICFTPVEVGPAVIAGLAPMAVMPGRQREGIGSRLVEEGLEACRRAGFGAVVVLGHPEYYPRFGFEPAAPKGLTSEYDVPEPVFMVRELVDGGMANVRGVARYHAAFGAFT